MEGLSSLAESCLLKEGSSGRDLIAILQKGSTELTQISLIVDENRILIGIATDGDVRRGLLKGLSLEQPAKLFANQNFVVSQLDETENINSAIEYARILCTKNKISQVPITDRDGRLIDLYITNLEAKESHIKTINNSCILMAGGKGIRLRPLTLKTPKPMLSIGGKPLLEIAMDQCISAGITNFYISVNYLKHKIIDYFGNGSNWGVSISYLEEEEPLGTAGPLELIKGKETSPVLVMNSDILTKFDIPNLIRFHHKTKVNATVCVRNHQTKIPFGVVEMEDSYIKNILEKPIINHHVNAGIYLIEPKAITLIKKKEKLDMPDFLIRIKDNLGDIAACPIHEYWLDVGQPETLAQASIEWDQN